nr:unnamed protein product [Callosobruchus analis]
MLKNIKKEEKELLDLSVPLSIEVNCTGIDYESLYFKLAFKDSMLNMEDREIMWIPPKSPHNLVEEVLYHDPWALLVSTIFLNRTRCMNARNCLFWFLIENSTAVATVDKYPNELERYFISLGLQKTRAVQVWRMSYDFNQKEWKCPRELYGIGQYGEDAYRMFCLGDFSVTPKDRFLKVYKAWYQKIFLKDVTAS